MWKFSGRGLKTPSCPASIWASCFTVVPREVTGRVIYASAWRMICQTGRCHFPPSFPMSAVFILRVISFQISLSWVVYWKQASAYVTCSCSLLCLGDFPQILKGDRLSVLFNGLFKSFYLVSRESSPARFDLRWDRPGLASGMVLDQSLIPHFVGILDTHVPTDVFLHTHKRERTLIPSRSQHPLKNKVSFWKKKDIRWC